MRLPSEYLLPLLAPETAETFSGERGHGSRRASALFALAVASIVMSFLDW
jgi:hypothetical protein